MIHIARVVEIRPEANAVDIEIMLDRRRFSGVQILSLFAGGDYGLYGLGIPTQTGYGASTTRKRDVFCAVAFAGTNPIVLGFLFPQVTQMLFDKETEPRYEEMRIDRHPSDVWSLIDGDGNIEIHHPGGAYVRIAEDPAFEDLKERDYQEKWKIEKNRDKRVHIHVEQAGQVAWIDIDPDGNTIVTAPVVKLDTPKTICTGDLTVDGDIYSGGKIGAEDDVISDGGRLSLNNHTHGNSPPVAGGAGMPTKHEFETEDPLPADNPDY